MAPTGSRPDSARSGTPAADSAEHVCSTRFRRSHTVIAGQAKGPLRWASVLPLRYTGDNKTQRP